MSESARHDKLSAIKLALLARQARSNEHGTFLVAEPIAIVGMSCRFPGAAGPEAYWRLLAGGGDAISEVPADRWDSATFYDPDISAPGRMNTRWGGFVEDIDRFDAAFFGISPREAARMDPQQRLMLEVAWEALEDAGQTRESLAGSQTGVFVACCQNDYGHLQFSDLAVIDAHTASGTAHSIVANRLSFLLNLRGPSVAIDTACSSSLVALHLACQSLRERDCDVALAGGVNAILSPEMTISLSKFGFLAPDGRCKTFDAAADGFVRSEGCGALVLKRLAEALGDGDPILAVIRGSAVNQDGRTNALTAPSGLAQQAVVRQALENAKVLPSEIGYVEAHGTGTKLGDPIEVEALAAVFGPPAAVGRPILLGSAKTNIGHLEAAAGLAGLIKVVLSMQHDAIPPHVHFRAINPHIALGETPFVIPTALTPWPAVERRYAGVSSFGFGGTNAHVIVEEAPRLPEGDATAARDESPSRLLTLSAPTAAALDAVARTHIDWLPRAIDGGARLADVCYTAAARRTHHAHRLAVVGRCTSDLVDALSRAVADGPGSFEPRAQARRPSVAFVFSGQGAQWPRMARELLRDEPVFRRTLERCDALVQGLAGWSLLAELAASASTARLDQTAIAQPALVAVELALATLWRSWGIEPAAVTGHSVGEIAAACTAGALSVEDAVRLVVQRGRLMQRATGRGRMAAVELSREDAERALDGHAGRVAIAALNGPRSTVLSGDTAAVQAVVSALGARGVTCRMLPVDYAFHSHHMDGIDEELARALVDLSPRASAIPIVSTVTGELATAQDFDAAYWRKNVRAPVMFSRAVETLAARGCRVFVEVGPHPVLLESIRRALADAADVLAVPSMRRGQPERAVMLTSVGALYRRGSDVDWDAVHPGPRRCVSLPPYPWQRERYWLETPEASPVLRATAPESSHPLLGSPLRSPVLQGLVLQSTLGADVPGFVRDHRVLGSVVLPATAYLEMAISGAARMLGGEPHAIQDLLIREPMPLADSERRLVQTAVERLDADRAAVRIFSVDAGVASEPSEWRLHATATVLRRAAAGAAPEAPEAPRTDTDARVDSTEVPGTAFYAQLDAVGLDLGPAFRGIVMLWRGPGRAVAEIAVPAEIAAELGTYRAHPALVHACLQALVAASGSMSSDDRRVSFGAARSVLVHRPLTPRLWAHATVTTGATPDGVTGDVRIHDADGRLVATVEGITLVRVSAGACRRPDVTSGGDATFALTWQPRPLPPVSSSPASWLVMADRGGLGERLAQALTRRSQACVLARPGDGFAVRGTAEYEIDAERPEDLERVLGAAFEGSAARRGVVVLAGLDAPDLAEGGAAVDALAPSLRRALAISQAVVRSGAGVSAVWFVTRGAVAVDAEPAPVAVSQAPLSGLARVIAVEQPDLRCATFDLDPAGSSMAPDEVERLVDEVLGGDTEDRIAVRAGERYVARLTAGLAAHARHAGSTTLSHADAAPAGAVRNDATYLVTGGLGGLGLAVARWLVDRGARHLALVGRRGPTEPARAAIRELEGAGAHVAVLSADVSRAGDVAGVLEHVDREGPPLGGIVHAAGVVDDAVLLQQDWQRFDRVMASKVDGAWILHTLTRTRPLDLFVLFSSAASLLGSAGQANYAAANAFLDALAHRRRAGGLPGLAVNWGPWESIGMAARLGEADRRRLERSGMSLMRADRALDAFGRTLAAGIPQAGILAIDWRAFVQDRAAGGVLPLVSDLVSTSPVKEATAQTGGARPGGFVETLEGVPGSQRRRLIAGHVLQLTLAVLGLPASHPLDPQQGLRDVGLDSLMAVELRNALQRSLGRPLPATLAFDHPTLEALATYVERELFPAGGDRGDESPTDAKGIVELATLSDEEAEALLSRELESLGEPT
jgi:myxalamid-type polyketide synthase MxaE and MxaD